MDDAVILLITVFIALLLTLFNFTTVAITLFDRKLRSRISNYPVISFLIASTFQGMFAAPITTYKQMEHREHVTGWVCDLSRVSYYLCHHLVKISLVIVSFDRLFCIKYPFKYAKYGRKANMLILLAACWAGTIFIDLLPFIHVIDDGLCHYVPKKEWILFIIIFYNIAPFVLMTANYMYIWNIAANAALTDRRISKCVLMTIPEQITPINNDNKESMVGYHTRRRNTLKFMLELKATKTSLGLVGVYIICWGPLGLFYIIENFCPSCIMINRKLEKGLHDGLTYLCFSSNILAPFFYCWLRRDYRKVGKRILQKWRLFRTSSYKTRNKSQTETSYPTDNNDIADENPAQT